MKHKVIKPILFIWLALFFSLVGFAVYDRWIEVQARNSIIETSTAVKEQIIDTASINTVSGESVNTAETSPPFIEINGESYIGILQIPVLALEVPINNEVDDTRLRDSPCRYFGSIHEQMIVSGHNYERHFGGIKNLSPGHAVMITDAAGAKHVYSVELVTELDGTDIDGMINSPYDLTLFTCTKSRTERVTVRCSRRSTEAPVKASTPPVIEVAENAPPAPAYSINYKNESIRLRKGFLFSIDGGYNFREVTSAENATVDVSDCITSGTTIYIRKASTNRDPASRLQAIVPAARFELEDKQLVPVNGRLALDESYEVYNPLTQKWGRMPKVTADSVLKIRLKNDAATINGVTLGNAASLPGDLVIRYGEYTSGRKGIIAAEIICPQESGD